MKELFLNLKHIGLESSKHTLIDTCFFVYVFDRGKQKDFEAFIDVNKVAITSFNVEELNHIRHKIKDKTKQHIHHFLKKNPDIKVLEVPVHPGNRNAEIDFMNITDPFLARDAPDPSDGVLIAAAIRTRSNILTKDKHDIFIGKFKNYLDRYDINVFKDFHSMM